MNDDLREVGAITITLNCDANHAPNGTTPRAGLSIRAGCGYRGREGV